ncbi:hypothetical protein EVAR_85778_1 [Eumeta japonica]|uniref:Uncharacterized protein n=1 Tax=Eumeta variegata TaxID=151549 RepID=A0A4C1UQG6_EUMVA|nr:hypothetical protein EVAR_85778_1 [Eumeta japonica]
MRCIRSVDSVGSSHAIHKLPRRSSPAQANSAQVFIRTVVPCCASTTCPFLTTGLSAHSLTFLPNSSYEVLETRICSIRGWKHGKGRCGPLDSGHAQSQGAQLRWERPSPGVPTVRLRHRRDKAIRRRDRTRQPVTTPQLVTPLKMLNSEMSLTPLATVGCTTPLHFGGASVAHNSVFSGLSSDIQNDLIKSIAQVIRDEIKSEINFAKFVSVIADETPDISHREQMSVIFRYLTKTGIEVVEFSMLL